MRTLTQFLKRYTSLKSSDTEVKKVCVFVVRDVTGIEIETKHISVRNNALQLQVPSAIRSEIHFHKKEILRGISEKLGEESNPRTIY